jgi:putative phosphoribosyl transferase
MFKDRRHAGQLLAIRVLELLPIIRKSSDGRLLDVVVLGLARGGVPVAKEVADKIQAPLGVMVVRKIGVPGQEELAMGAVASGGAVYLNQALIDRLGIDDASVRRLVAKKNAELLQRERMLVGPKIHVPVQGKCVILVDDGLATGATMKAGIKAVKVRQPAKVVVAVPVSPSDTLADMGTYADEVICLSEPEYFYGVGGSYHVFATTSDEEVISLLK